MNVVVCVRGLRKRIFFFFFFFWGGGGERERKKERKREGGMEVVYSMRTRTGVNVSLYIGIVYFFFSKSEILKKKDLFVSV